MRSQQNTVETDTKRILRLPRDNTKITKNRSVVVCDTTRCSKLAWTLLKEGSGAFGSGPEIFLDDSTALLACPGRPKIGLGAPFGRSKAVLSASGCVSETALVAQDDPRSIFRRYGLDLRRFSCDFSSIFARAACDEAIDSRSLASSRRGPRRWSNVSRNDCRALHVQPNVVAYPHAHLVLD